MESDSDDPSYIDIYSVFTWIYTLEFLFLCDVSREIIPFHFNLDIEVEIRKNWRKIEKRAIYTIKSCDAVTNSLTRAHSLFSELIYLGLINQKFHHGFFNDLFYNVTHYGRQTNRSVIFRAIFATLFILAFDANV